MARRDPQNGLVVFDEHFLDATFLAANTGEALTSDYTEQGARPGQVAAVDGQQLVPVITNGQADDVLLRVARAGHAGRVGLAYSADGSSYRGWHGPKPLGWESVSGLYVSGTGYEALGAVVIPSTQAVVVAYAAVGSGSIYVRTRSVDDETWSAAVEVTTSSCNALALAITPDERIVLVRVGAGNNRLSTFYSDDGGVTWNTLARAEDIAVTLGYTPEGGQVRACCVGATQLVLFITDPGTSICTQYASADHGITIDEVDTIDDVRRVQIGRTADGSVVVVVDPDPYGAATYGRRISSAYQPITLAADLGTPFATGDTLGVAEDADGTLYLVVVRLGVLLAHYSVDGGAIWVDNEVAFAGAVDVLLDNGHLVAAAGRLLVIGNGAAGEGVDESVGVLKLSTWSSHEWTDIPHVDGGVYWTPWTLPDDAGWTATGAGTPTLTLAHLRFVTAANTLYYQRDGTGHSFTCALHAILACTVGAASTAAMGAQLTATSAGATYALRILLWDDTLRVTDNIGATTIADVALDGTLDWEVLAYFTAAGSARVAYKRPNDHDWIEIPAVAAHSFSNGGALESNCWSRIGVLSASTVTGWLRFAAFYETFSGVSSGSGLAGKRLSAVPYPLPDLVDDDGRMVHVGVRGGVGLQGQLYSVAPDHDYGLESAFVGLHPSPTAREWRSVDDDSDAVIAFDLGGSTWIGGAVCVLFERCNFETARLEYYDGATWQVAGTYTSSTGFSGLTFDRDGSSIYPRSSGTADSDRMLHEQEVAGTDGAPWWVRYNDGIGGADVLRNCCSNTGAWWTAESTARCVVNLDDVVGGDPAGGTAHLCAPGGLLVVHLPSFLLPRRWRIVIPTQATVDGFFRAGAIGIGRLIPFGQGWGWGASGEERGQYDTAVDDAGVATRARRGELVRSWVVDWQDGVPMREPRGVVAADHVGVSGGLRLEPVAADWLQLRGVLRRTRGQTVPVVAVSVIPSSTTTITDRTLYLYGLLGNSVAHAQVVGREGTNEAVRIEGVRVDGYPGC